MEDQEHSCLLRRLSLCDGQRAADVPPRTRDVPCYCVELRKAETMQWGNRALEARTARARVVARADEADRIRRRRQFLPDDF